VTNKIVNKPKQWNNDIYANIVMKKKNKTKNGEGNTKACKLIMEP